MDDPKKPPIGGKAFDDLARKLAAVPKREVARAEKRYEQRKKKRRKS
jgi:hypothetical protein